MALYIVIGASMQQGIIGIFALIALYTHSIQQVLQKKKTIKNKHNCFIISLCLFQMHLLTSKWEDEHELS